MHKDAETEILESPGGWCCMFMMLNADGQNEECPDAVLHLNAAFCRNSNLPWPIDIEQLQGCPA
jgi:hypothetical protein